MKTIYKTISINVFDEDEAILASMLEEKAEEIKEEIEEYEGNAIEDESTLYEIDWDTDGEDIKDLPKQVRVPDIIEEEDIADWLSDIYGYCVNAFYLV